MCTFKVKKPDFIPRMWDIIEVKFPGYKEPVYGMVVHIWGSPKKGKVNIMCKSMPKTYGLHLIWKESEGWHCFFGGRSYSHLEIRKHDGVDPSYFS